MRSRHHNERAIPKARRAVELREAVQDSGHPDVARDLNNLAELLRTTGRYAEAEPLVLRAYRIASTSGDPEVLSSVQSELTR